MGKWIDDELLNAIRLISDECDQHTDCEQCIFHKGEDMCRLRAYPKFWKLEYDDYGRIKL